MTDKSKKLLVFIHEGCQDHVMRVRDARCDFNEDDADRAVKFKISTNRDSLKKMLKNLGNAGYLMSDDDDACSCYQHWYLTGDGLAEYLRICCVAPVSSDSSNSVEKLSLECDKLAKKVMELEAELEEKDKEIECLSAENARLKNASNSVCMYVDQAQKFASFAQSIANGMQQNDALVQENAALKKQVAVIRDTLTETYAKLCEKETALDKMETELSRVLASFNEMAKWIENIKAGR